MKRYIFCARGLQQAKEQLDILKLSETERQAYERYQDDFRQQTSAMQSSWHQGRQEGHQEGETLLLRIWPKTTFRLPDL